MWRNLLEHAFLLHANVCCLQAHLIFCHVSEMIAQSQSASLCVCARVCARACVCPEIKIRVSAGSDGFCFGQHALGF